MVWFQSLFVGFFFIPSTASVTPFLSLIHQNIQNLLQVSTSRRAQLIPTVPYFHHSLINYLLTGLWLMSQVLLGSDLNRVKLDK